MCHQAYRSNEHQQIKYYIILHNLANRKWKWHAYINSLTTIKVYDNYLRRLEYA